jgi:arylsulfatase A-like enzyme
MIHQRHLSLWLCSWIACWAMAGNSHVGATSPNIVFVLADDLGWRDLSCYGSPFCETPHIDALAASGMKFTNAYSAASICSPTRASIMTGKYPVRTGITDYIPGLKSKPEQMPTPRTATELNLEEVTLGEMFQAAGYQTFYTGKWHLGGKGFEPPQQGFEFYVGDAQLGQHNRDWQIGGRMTEAFERFVRQQRNPQKPFLAMLAFHEPHTPILEYPEHIDHFRRKTQTLPEAPTSHTERDGQTRARQDDPAYGSEVAGLDSYVGQVLKTLEQLDLVDNTIVVFFSDNGGLSTKAERGPTNNDPLRAGKGWLYEGGIRVPLIVRLPGQITAGSVSDQVTASCDLLPTLLELAGLPLQPQQHADGRSLAPVLLGRQATLPQRPIYWHYPHYHGSTWAPGAAMRDGDWKLIQFDHYHQLELYNLADDLSESKNLAAAEPERVRAMQQQLADWQASVGAIFATPNNMRTENLVAWCIVPFDANQRGPEERAKMLRDLGMQRMAYDWREEHVATWDAEVDALRRHSIELTAFWCSSTLSPLDDPKTQRIVDFLRRRGVHTQLWLNLPNGELEKISSEEQRVARAAIAVKQLAEQVRPLGCQVGLYNHGGWIGKPQNLVKIMQQLSSEDNVGIVYNFHHAHQDLAEFPQALYDMAPYLMCLNLNGTHPSGGQVPAQKIAPIGSGALDTQILSWIRMAQYAGPIGILDHREELDARQSLQLNLDGLHQLLKIE